MRKKTIALRDREKLQLQVPITNDIVAINDEYMQRSKDAEIRRLREELRQLHELHQGTGKVKKF